MAPGQRPRPHRAGPGQESVWDYPRPPRLEPARTRIQAVFAGEVIADTLRAFRVLETSHPPVYYLPPADVLMERLRPAAGASHCEWKGRAAYYDLVAGSRRANRAAWCYPSPSNAFAALSDHVAFYLPALDRGLVDGVEACAQPGGFYGGWITPELVGPFKGEPGTEGW